MSHVASRAEEDVLKKMMSQIYRNYYHREAGKLFHQLAAFIFIFVDY